MDHIFQAYGYMLARRCLIALQQPTTSIDDCFCPFLQSLFRFLSQRAQFGSVFLNCVGMNPYPGAQFTREVTPWNQCNSVELLRALRNSGTKALVESNRSRVWRPGLEQEHPNGTSGF